MSGGGLRLQESSLRSDNRRDTDEDPDRDEPVSWLRDKRIFAVCAIGNPHGFLAALDTAGAVVADRLILADHDPYAPGTMTRLTAKIRSAAGGAAVGSGLDARQSKPLIDAVVTTEKDWSKLRGRTLDWPCPVVRPALSVEFLTARAEFLLALSKALSHRGLSAGRSVN
jgi:tetraacyldisaccharide-1-P 4'-kinase